MSIFIEKETDLELDFNYEEIIEKVIEYAISYVDCPYEAEVNVVLSDNEGIREVNKEFRDIDNATDVLSFPMLEYDEPGKLDFLENDDEMAEYFNPETGELLLGDIMISFDKVISQAEEYGHSATRELAFLVAHSMLHLFGYDHIDDEERRVMEEKQEEILSGLKIFREV